MTNELASYLATFVSYNPETGAMKWATDWCNGIKAGDTFGVPNRQGHLWGCMSYHCFPVHNMAWFMVCGYWPHPMLDHIDGNPANNKIENLRLSSIVLNGQNRKEHRAGKLVGTCYDKRRNKWGSRLKINGKRIWLGQFDTELEAHIAYLKEREKAGGILSPLLHKDKQDDSKVL